MSRVVALDLRSLGLMRIGLGLVLLLDWIARGFHFRAHYSSEGILPLRDFLNQPDLSYRFWSVFYFNDSPWFVGVLFLLGVLSATSLTLGYRTAWSGWISWVLLISLHHRNPLVLHKGDTYLLLLIFWANFLPWGRAFSLDGRRGEEENAHVSAAGACYLAQVCLLYWFTALLRSSPMWQVDGSALYHAYHLDPLLRESAYMILGWGTGWLKVFSLATVWLELLGPFLLLLPWGVTRLGAVLLIWSFHLGIFATMDLLNFAQICIAGTLGLLPSLVWSSRPGAALERWLENMTNRLGRGLPGAVREYQPPRPGPRWSPLGQIVPVLALLLACGFLWVDYKHPGLESPALNVVRVTGADQSWGMFAHPPVVFGWQSARARTSTGRTVDLVTGIPYPAGSYSGKRSWVDQRWAMYRNMLMLNGFGAHANVYLIYLVEQWDRKHPDDPVLEAQYLWHKRITGPDYLLAEEAEEVMAQYRR